MAEVWDTTTPAGSDPVSQGDDRIRELKVALQAALQGQDTEGLEAIFPGSSPSSDPVFRYRGLKGTTAARPAFGQYGLYFNETLNSIQRDSGAAWVDVGTHIPAGTVMVFYQASAPTGWTAVAVNDKFLRVVTAGGTGGSTGGTVAASTSLAHTHTLAHTHSETTHTHSIPLSGYGTALANPGSGYLRTTSGGGDENYATLTPESGQVTNGPLTTGGASSETTSSALGAFAYADVVIATKD